VFLRPNARGVYVGLTLEMVAYLVVGLDVELDLLAGKCSYSADFVSFCLIL
jgi:hypothetical protein